MNTLQKNVLLVVLIAGVAAAAWVGWLRICAEQANDTVAVAVDYASAARAASLVGKTPQDFLTQLKATGITHVAITEVSLAELAETNRLLSATKASIVPVMSLSPAARKRIIQQTEAKLPSAYPHSYERYIKLRRIAPQLGEIGLGYDEAVETVKAAGLKIIARPRPDWVNTPEAVDAALQAAQDIGADAVVFAGTQVLGHQSLLEYVATKMQALGLQFGYIELAAQDGEKTLARHLDYQLIRTHSISEAELLGLSPQRAIDRFSLAVRERKVRLCYVHLFFNQGDPLGVNVDYLRRLTDRVRADGFRLGTAGPFAPVKLPGWALPLIFAGIGAAFMWLIQPIAGLSPIGFWVITALIFADAAVEGLVGWNISRQLGALFAALIFPIWGLLTTHLRSRPTPRPVVSGVIAFLRISAISAAGGLLIAGCLTDTSYLVNIEQFRGVKLSALLPLLVVAAFFAARSMRRYWEVRTELGEGKAEGSALRAGLGQALDYAVRYWHALAIVLGLATVALLLLRSGNEPGIGVSGLEIKVRCLLDRLLLVRPRSKEIFFAHPVMILSLILLARGVRRGLWVGLTLGAIGQVSIVNTFCHLHTPLVVSLLRVAHGLWLGIVFGLVWWLIVWGIGRFGHRTRAPAQD